MTAGALTYAGAAAWRPAQDEVQMCWAVLAACGDERIELKL
jgi:hypothetical protein